MDSSHKWTGPHMLNPSQSFVSTRTTTNCKKVFSVIYDKPSKFRIQFVAIAAWITEGLMWSIDLADYGGGMYVSLYCRREVEEPGDLVASVEFYLIDPRDGGKFGSMAIPNYRPRLGEDEDDSELVHRLFVDFEELIKMYGKPGGFELEVACEVVLSTASSKGVENLVPTAESINLENAVKLLVESESDLKKAAVKFVILHFGEIAKRREWLEAMKSHPGVVSDVLVAAAVGK